MHKQYHNAKKLNPAVQQAKIEQRVKQAMLQSRKDGIEYGSIVTILLIIMVLSDKTNMPEEELEYVMKQLGDLSDSLMQDYMSVPDLIKTLKEEHNFSIKEDKLIKFYPELEAYLLPEDEASKA